MCSLHKTNTLFGDSICLPITISVTLHILALKQIFVKCGISNVHYNFEQISFCSVSVPCNTYFT